MAILTCYGIFQFGIRSKLDHFSNLQIGSDWITPFYESPLNDMGYDISNYTAVNPLFGTMEDFEELIKEAKKRGIRSKLDHFSNLQIGSDWITPFYESPLNDMGYDISNYTAVNPLFGTMEDFEELIKEAKKRGIRSKLDHFSNLQIGSDWITPFYESPLNDMGYDISNYTAVNPLFGTMEDFEELIKEAKKRGKWVNGQ
ncbi:hypothetical protein V9T40_012003 [Parthenolecanium corni]|uniref:Glycosyl hydrolase family 13 catalytic domain-containing protein n=1 Tax=Parthenolecanium corni TaxID=536013 RepID=A0AAN9XYX8_9HEMI